MHDCLSNARRTDISLAFDLGNNIHIHIRKNGLHTSQHLLALNSLSRRSAGHGCVLLGSKHDVLGKTISNHVLNICQIDFGNKCPFAQPPNLLTRIIGSYHGVAPHEHFLA